MMIMLNTVYFTTYVKWPLHGDMPKTPYNA